MVDVKFGLELELGYNRKYVDFNVTGYHRENVGANFSSWSVTNDSSLNTSDSPFNSADVAELVSLPVIGKGEVMEILQEVKDKYPNKDFKDLFFFNSSMGAHIHFSTFRAQEDQMVFMSLYKKLRENVMKKVEEKYPHIYPKFKKQYFRGHAAEQKDILINKGMRGEINYTSGKGVEWRGFNLLGVTTWDELFGMYEIAIDCINDMLSEYEQSGYKEQALLEITDEQIRKAEMEIVEILEQIFKED